MPRVHCVKKARKDNASVKKGETYYWWKFRHGGIHTSATYPKQSQLTQSSFKSSMYSVEEGVSAAVDAFGMDHDFDALASALNEAAEEVRNCGEEAQSSLDNMPEQLQESSSAGELLTTRIEQCETIADELESAASDIENIERPESFEDLADQGDEPLTDEQKQEKLDEAIDEAVGEARDLAEGISWDFE